MQVYRVISNTDDYISHHGVKGQKWGVIRTPEQLGRKPKKTYKYEFDETANPYKLRSKNFGDFIKDYAQFPIALISDHVKRFRDPEYKHETNAFMARHKKEIYRRFILMGYVPVFIGRERST